MGPPEYIGICVFNIDDTRISVEQCHRRKKVSFQGRRDKRVSDLLTPHSIAGMIWEH